MRNKVKEVMARVFGITVAEISDEASAEKIEQWDSINHLILVMTLEEEFGIQFDEHQIGEIINLELIIKALQSRTSQK
ncbi:unnamed protein product [marine sediment metagenome]|uniref:Carrier domain-containing protein n=1 Tax=marine sediment metagenome TaxID=412755 RepID=X1R7W3_9ZZZZ